MGEVHSRLPSSRRSYAASVRAWTPKPTRGRASRRTMCWCWGISSRPTTPRALQGTLFARRVKCLIFWLSARSGGTSTPKQMCIQADLDNADALRHMNKNNSERAVCITHPLAPISTSFLFVFDTDWVVITCEHQGRDAVLQTGLKIHWSRRSASSCFNRVWRVTKSSAKHHSLLSPWVMQHQPWPSPSAWLSSSPYS